MACRVAGGAGWYFIGVTRAQAAVQGLAHMREQSHTRPRVPSGERPGHVLRQGWSG